MNQYTVLAIVFFVVAILNFILGITTSAANDSPNWLYLISGFLFLAGGGVWLMTGAKSKNENDQR
ncbi:MAG: hypothetical protein AAF902_21210 [Chloroflexota bacterium]